jgi:hypothetical protein
VFIGDAVVIGAAVISRSSRYELIDQRAWPPLALAVTFALAVIALSRWRGLRARQPRFVARLYRVRRLHCSMVNRRSRSPLSGRRDHDLYALSVHGVSLRTSVSLLGTLISLA